VDRADGLDVGGVHADELAVQVILHPGERLAGLLRLRVVVGGVHHVVLQLAVGELLVRPHTQSLGHRVLDVDAVLADLAEDLLDALLDGLRLGLAREEDQFPDAILVDDLHLLRSARGTHNLRTLLVFVELQSGVGCVAVVAARGSDGSDRVNTVHVLAPAPVVSEDVVEYHVRHGVSSPLGDLSTSMVPAPGPTASGAVLCGELLAWRIWGRTTSSTHTWNRSACWVFDRSMSR